MSSILLQYPKNPKIEPNWRAGGTLERVTLSDFLTSIVANIKKLKGDSFGKFVFEKSLTMPEKTERDPLGFFNIHSVAKHQKKLKRDPLRKKIEKSLTMPKKTERGPFSFARYCTLR